MTVLGFAAEWYDPIAREITNLYLKFFLEDGTIELLKNGIKQSTFLKRIHYPQVAIQDMFIGSSLSIFNRVIILTDYANTATRDYLKTREVHFLCVVKADSLSRLNRILDVVDQHRLSIGRTRTANESLPGVGADTGDIVFEFVGIQGQNGEDFIGDVDKIGVGATVTSAPFQEISAVMDQFSGIAAPENATLCLLKPHVLRNGEAASCISEIVSAGFKVDALFSIHLSMDIIEHMFDVYRGIYPNYNNMVEHMCSGPCLAIMITGSSGDTVSEFRDFAGPFDPKLAKLLRPKSLRAKFGLDCIYNAVHCTDLPDDGQMECDYIFQTLASL